MNFVPVLLEGETVTSVLDDGTVTFVVNAAKQVIGLLTTPPLGTFITIGIVGAVACLVGIIVSVARRK